MRTQICILAMALAAGLAMAGCDDEHYYCGDGTEEVNGACIGGGGECGPGTHEEDGQCVLDDDVIICGEGTTEVDGECVVITETGLPPVLDSVTSPTPYPSGGLMILVGDNFALTDSGPMIVNVDGVPTTGVQVLSNNFAIADLPASTVITVEVEIVNDQGDDALDFDYTGLYAAEGGTEFHGGKVFGPPPPATAELHIIDPRTGAHALVGAITTDAGTVMRPVTAMAFDAAGTLWAVEAVDGADMAGLLTINPRTAAATEVAVVTVVDPVPPSLAFGPTPVLASASIPDIEFIGGVLYGFCADVSQLCSIDTSTGDTTLLGSSVFWNGGNAVVAAADGTLLVSHYQSDLYGYDTTGAYQGYANFFTDKGSDYVSSLTWLDGSLYGTSGNYSSGLLRFDFEDDEILSFGLQDFEYDAIATPPALDGTPGAAPAFEIEALDLIHPDLDLAAYEPLVATHPVRPPAALVADDVLPANANLDRRGRRGVALTEVARGDRVTVRTETEERTFSRAELAGYRLVENRRGQLKLVDAAGRKVMRGITAIE